MIYQADTFLRIHSRRVSKEQIVCPKFQLKEKNVRKGLQGLKKQIHQSYDIKFIKRCPLETKYCFDNMNDLEPRKKDDKAPLQRFDYLEAIEGTQKTFTPMFFEDEDSFYCLSSNNLNSRPINSVSKVLVHQPTQARKGLDVKKVQINPFPQKPQTEVKRYKTPKRPLTSKSLHRDKTSSLHRSRNSCLPLSTNIAKFLRRIANNNQGLARSRSGSTLTEFKQTRNHETRHSLMRKNCQRPIFNE